MQDAMCAVDSYHILSVVFLEKNLMYCGDEIYLGMTTKTKTYTDFDSKHLAGEAMLI